MTSLLRQRRAEVGALCRRYHVRRLEVFGSAASGQERPGESDLDFLVEFDSLPAGGYADAYFGLLEALEALSGQPVDLVVASAIKNPFPAVGRADQDSALCGLKRRISLRYSPGGIVDRRFHGQQGA